MDDSSPCTHPLNAAGLDDAGMAGVVLRITFYDGEDNLIATKDFEVPRLLPPAESESEMGGLHLDGIDVDDFAGFVASQQPSAKDNGEPTQLDIVSLDIAGDTAAARVRDDYLGMTFMDTLSLLKTDGRWSIYTKLFHVEGPSS